MARLVPKTARDLRSMGIDVALFIPGDAVVKEYSEHRPKAEGTLSVTAWCVWIEDGQWRGSIVEGVTL